MTSAGEPPTQESVRAFISAFAKSESPVRSAVVNWSSRIEDCKAGLASATRLRDYRDYLAQARAYKAYGATGARDIDKQVLVEARRALNDVHALATSTLSIVASFPDGALDQMAESGRQALESSGAVSTRELWTQVTAGGKNREALNAAGIDGALLGVLDEVMSTIDFEVRAERHHVLVEGEIHGEPVTGLFTTTPRPRRAADTADLLTRGRLSALSGALRGGEPAYLNGSIFPDHDVHVEDVALYAALASYQEGVRHVRKLEDTGLETYLGSDPATLVIIGYVALAVALAGVVVMALFCEHFTSEFTSHDPNFSEGSTGCVIGKVLFWLGILVFWLAKLTQVTSHSNSGSIGSAITHGTLRDFEVSEGLGRR